MKGTGSTKGSGSRLLVAGVVWLAACTQPPERKVLVVGIDGVRPDVLAEVETPNLDALALEGVFSPEARTSEPTVSGPAWSSTLTGVWPEKHGVLGNSREAFGRNDYAAYPDFLTRAEQYDPELTTLAVLDWPPLGAQGFGGPLVSDAVEKVLLDGEALGYPAADSLSVEAAAERFAGDIDAAFVYLGNPDVAAHEHGGLSEEYRAAIATADRQVGLLLEAIRSRPTFADENWLVLVCTDHGHVDAGGHGGQSPEERTVFYLAGGPAAVPGTPDEPPAVVDVAVTALTHLGISIDPTWGLDGRAVGLRRE